MATAKKLPSGSWRCQVFSHFEEQIQPDGTVKKKRIYKSFTCDDPSTRGKRKCEAEAAAWAADKEQFSGIQSIDFGDAMDNYINSRENVLSPRTISEYRKMRKRYCKDLMEKKIENGDFVSKQVASEPTAQAQEKPKEKKVFDKPVPADIQAVVDNWGRIKRHISNPYKIYLNDARFSVKGEDTLLIVFNAGSIGYEGCNKPEVIEMLTNVISEEIQKQVRIEMTILENNQSFSDYFMEVVSKIKMEVEEEDF